MPQFVQYSQTLNNPADEFLIIDYFSKTEVTSIIVKVFDLNGKHMLTESIQGAPSSKTIDIQGLKPGTYVFSIYEDGLFCKAMKISIQ